MRSQLLERVSGVAVIINKTKQRARRYVRIFHRGCLPLGSLSKKLQDNTDFFVSVE